MPPGSAQNWAHPSDAGRRSCAQRPKGWAAAPAGPELTRGRHKGCSYEICRDDSGPKPWHPGFFTPEWLADLQAPHSHGPTVIAKQVINGFGAAGIYTPAIDIYQFFNTSKGNGCSI